MSLDLKALFGGAQGPLVGLDISTSSVRMVELSEAGKDGMRLDRCAWSPCRAAQSPTAILKIWSKWSRRCAA